MNKLGSGDSVPEFRRDGDIPDSGSGIRYPVQSRGQVCGEMRKLRV